ncbi:MAG: hypothetical protein ACRDP1_13265 [Nocardioidaceae bacterium]
MTTGSARLRLHRHLANTLNTWRTRRTRHYPPTRLQYQLPVLVADINRTLCAALGHDWTSFEDLAYCRACGALP